jgi:hypothetical protein
MGMSQEATIMVDRIFDWVQRNYSRVALIVLAALVLLLALTFASVAKAATLTGSYTLPTQYEDGTPLPVANIKHIRVEAGTCSPAGLFGANEGTQLVIPPGAAFSITSPRAFGKFCVRAQTETVSGTLSEWSNTVVKTIAEPAPKPPVMLTTGGWVWTLKANGTLRFVGTIPAGRRCAGLSPLMEPDLFPVERRDVRLEQPVSKLLPLVAQCGAT